MLKKRYIDKITTHRTVVILAVTLVIATILGGCSNTPFPKQAEYVGRVLDGSTGASIHGAKVTLDFRGAPPIVYTDSEGIYRFTISVEGDKLAGRVRVEATDYPDYDRNITLSLNNPNIEDIRLKPLPTPTPQSTNTPVLSTSTPTLTSILVAATNTSVPPTDTPTPTPTSVIVDVFADISRFLTIEDLKYVGTYESGEFIRIYSSEDWVICPSEIPSRDSIEGAAIIGEIRGEWMIPECGDSFETRVREDLRVLQNTQGAERLYKDIVAEAQKAPWFSTGYEFATEYGSFWVMRSDYQDGTTATMVAGVDEAVIELSIESNAVIDEMNLNALTLSAIVRLRKFPLTKGVPILLDTSLFSERAGRSLVIYPIPQTRRVYDLRPTIWEIIQKYGEPDRIIKTKLTFDLDALRDPIELDAEVYYYGGYGFGILLDQVIDEETLDYIRETYGSDDYEILESPKNGEVIWVVVD